MPPRYKGKPFWNSANGPQYPPSVPSGKRYRRHKRRKQRPKGIRPEKDMWAWLRFRVFKRDGFVCAYCGKGRNDGVLLQCDHIIPICLGGSNKLRNLVTACQPCNTRKSGRPLPGKQRRDVVAGVFKRWRAAEEVQAYVEMESDEMDAEYKRRMSE